MEALAAVVAHTMQPAAGAAAAPKKGERLQDQTEHKKVVEKGVPPGADKGQSGRKVRRPHFFSHQYRCSTGYRSASCMGYGAS